MEKKRPPFWLWLNILSLDAPLVAVAWVWMLKKALYVYYLQIEAIWVLFGVVWCIYVLDRLLDVWTGKRKKTDSHRHAITWKLRFFLLPLILFVFSYCCYYSLHYLPSTFASAGLVGMLFVGIYYLCLFLQKREIPFLKNIIAGMIFAYGTAIPVRLYVAPLEVKTVKDVYYPLLDFAQRGLGQGLFDSAFNLVSMVVTHSASLFFCMETAFFGILCALNITAIDLWESARKSDDPEVKATHEITLSMGIMALVSLALLWVFMGADDYSKPYFYSIMVACSILHLINRTRRYFTLDAQRVLADVALVLPIPFYYLFITLQ